MLIGSKEKKNVNIFGNLPKGVPSYCVVSDALYATVEKWKVNLLFDSIN